MNLQQQIKEVLVKDHDIYISVGLKNPMKPSVFKDVVDRLLFENIGYMQSWGTHTKDDYIEILNNQMKENERIRTEHAAMREALMKIGSVIVTDFNQPTFYDCVRLANDTLFDLSKEEST